MEIAVFPYERRILENLEKTFGVTRDVVIGCATSLNLLTRLYTAVAVDYVGEFRAGRVVIMGLINHVHHLIIGGFQALEVGNSAVWSGCFRGLVETFGACVLISERPNSAPQYLESVSPGKLRSAAERAKPGLAADISRLNQIVHPVSGAIYAGLRVTDVEARTSDFQFGLRTPSETEVKEGVVVLANLALLIGNKFEQLAANDQALSSGKLIMRSDTAAIEPGVRSPVEAPVVENPE